MTLDEFEREIRSVCSGKPSRKEVLKMLSEHGEECVHSFSGENYDKARALLMWARASVMAGFPIDFERIVEDCDGDFCDAWNHMNKIYWESVYKGITKSNEDSAERLQ